MPSELTLLMIKTTGNKAALAPRMTQFPMTVTTRQTSEMLDVLRSAFPGAMAPEDSAEGGAMLVADDAVRMIDIWLNEPMIDGVASCYNDNLEEAAELAKDGHAMIVILS